MDANIEVFENSKSIRRNHEKSGSLTERAISNIDTFLRSEGIDYLIVGSIARYAYMKKDINEKNEIDIVVLNPSNQERARDIFNQIEERNGNIKIDDSLNEFLNKSESGELKLKHGKLEYPIPPEVSEERQLNIGSTVIKTLPPETLLHTFLLAGGKFREKDWHNALEYGRWLKKNVTYNHDQLNVFHEFGKNQWVLSPLKRIQYNWRKFAGNLPDPIKNTLLDNVYNLKGIKDARKAFNIIEEKTCGYKSNYEMNN